MELNPKIDVVIPIYNAVDVLVNCLNKLESNQKEIHKVILINDASTDREIDNILELFTQRNEWELINHSTNKGFVLTANEGLQISKNHTILLNSDTEVSNNWIKAFKQSIILNKEIGTITAWSNNAEICSFPRFLTNNIAPQNINTLSEILFKKYKPSYPIIPTAVGFCMLITKQAKNIVGYFDESQFGHGYGEENDYSFRVKKAGLKNILCDNAYVLHVGNESFRDLGLKPDESTMKRLLEKHPDYMKTIEEYIKLDPLASIRNKIIKILKYENSGLFKELM